MEIRVIRKIRGIVSGIRKAFRLFITEFARVWRELYNRFLATILDIFAIWFTVLAYASIITIFLPGLPGAIVFTRLSIIKWFVSFSILWFYFRIPKYRQMRLGVIFALMALFVVIYTNSFSAASIPSQKTIHSSMYIEKSKGMYFYDLHGSIYFRKSDTTLRQEILFGSGKLLDGNNSHYSFTPPSSTVGYSINITGETKDGKTVTLFYKENNSITDKSFPELKGEFVLNELTQYQATLLYMLPEVKPHTGVSFRLRGYQDSPAINNVYHSIQFDELFYECMTPCIIPVTQGLRVDPPVIRAVESRFLPKRNESYIQYDVKGNKTHEIWFIIRTLNRTQLILRNFSLAIIAGLTVALVSVLFDIRSPNPKNEK